MRNIPKDCPSWIALYAYREQGEDPNVLLHFSLMQSEMTQRFELEELWSKSYPLGAEEAVKP